MVGRFIWGAMYLAWTVEYAVQAGWSLTVPFVGLLPRTGLGAAKSGVNRHVFSFFIVVSMLMFVASWPAVAIPGYRGARVAGTVASTSQPAMFSRTKAVYECGKGCHRLQLLLAKVSGEPFITDTVFKRHNGFGVRIIDHLVLFN